MMQRLLVWLVALFLPTAASAALQSGGSNTFSTTPGVTRSVAKHAADLRLARDYGAICDGSSHLLSGTYATLAAAQAVFPAASALTQETDLAAINSMLLNGGAVKLPPGVCLINGTIVPTSGSSIVGYGQGVSTIRAENGSLPSFRPIWIGGTTTTTGVLLKSFTLDGGWPANGTNLWPGLLVSRFYAIDIYPAASFVTMDDLEIENALIGPDIRAPHVNLTNSYIHDNWGNGVYVIGSSSSPFQYTTDVIVRNNRVVHNALYDYPINVVPGAVLTPVITGSAVSSVTITNAGSNGTNGTYPITFAPGSSGCVGEAGTYIVSGGSITSTSVTTGGSGCASAPSATAETPTGTGTNWYFASKYGDVAGSYDGIDLNGLLQRVLVEGNYVSGGDILVLEPGNYSGTEYRSSDITLRGNIVDGSVENGINVQGPVDRFTAENNTARNLGESTTFPTNTTAHACLQQNGSSVQFKVSSLACIGVPTGNSVSVGISLANNGSYGVADSAAPSDMTFSNIAMRDITIHSDPSGAKSVVAVANGATNVKINGLTYTDDRGSNGVTYLIDASGAASNFEADNYTPFSGSSGTTHSISGQVFNPAGTIYMSGSNSVTAFNTRTGNISFALSDIAAAVDSANAPAAVTTLGLPSASTLNTAVTNASGACQTSGCTMSGAITLPTLAATDTSTHGASATAIKGPGTGSTPYGLVQGASVQTAPGGTPVSPFTLTVGAALGRVVTPQDFGALCNGSFSPTYNGTTGQQTSSVGAGTLGSGSSPLGSFGTTTLTGNSYANYGGTSTAANSFPALKAYTGTGINYALNPTYTQDWAAIESALAWLSGNGGGRLNFPAGTMCQINKGIYVPSNIKITHGKGGGVHAYPAANSLRSYVDYDIWQVYGSNVEIESGIVNGGGSWAQLNNSAVSPGAFPPIYVATNAGQVGGVTSGALPFPGNVAIPVGAPTIGPGFPAQTHLAPTPYLVQCTAGVQTTTATAAVVNGTSGGTTPLTGDIFSVVGGTGNIATQYSATVTAGVVTKLSLYTPGVYNTGSAPTGTVSLTDQTTGGVTGITATAATYAAITPAICGLNNITVTLNGVTQNTSTVIQSGANYTFNQGYWEGFDSLFATASAAQDTTAVLGTTTGTAASGQAVVTLTSTTGLSTGMFAFGSAGGNSSAVPTGATITAINTGNGKVTLSANLTGQIFTGSYIIFTASSGMSGSIQLPSGAFGAQSSQSGNTVGIQNGTPVWAISPQGVPYEIPDTEVACASQDGSQGGVTGAYCTGPNIWFTDLNGNWVYPNIPDYPGSAPTLTPTAIPTATPMAFGGIQPEHAGSCVVIEVGASNVQVHNMEVYGCTQQGIFSQGANYKVAFNDIHDTDLAGSNQYGQDTNGILYLVGPGLVTGNTITNPAVYNQTTLGGPQQPLSARRYPGGAGARGVSFPKGFDGIGVNQEAYDIAILGNHVYGDDIISNEPCNAAEVTAMANAGLTCPGTGTVRNILVANNTIVSDANSITFGGYGSGDSIIGNMISGQLPPLRGAATIAGIYLNLGNPDSDLTVKGNHIAASTGNTGIYAIAGFGSFGGVNISDNDIHSVGNGTGSGIEIHGVSGTNVGAGNVIQNNDVCDLRGSPQMQYAIDTNGAFNGLAAGAAVTVRNNRVCVGESGKAMNLQSTDSVAGTTYVGPVANRPSVAAQGDLWLDPTTGLESIFNSNAWVLFLPGAPATLVTRSITAGGSSCTSGATALTSLYNEVTSGTGYVVLPAYLTNDVTVFNRSGGAITVCPPAGGALDGGSANVGVSLANGGTGVYDALSSTVEYTKSVH